MVTRALCLTSSSSYLTIQCFCMKGLKTSQDVSKERIRLQAVESYRKRKGWDSRPGSHQPPLGDTLLQSWPILTMCLVCHFYFAALIKLYGCFPFPVFNDVTCSAKYTLERSVLDFLLATYMEGVLPGCLFFRWDPRGGWVCSSEIEHRSVNQRKIG